MSLKLDPRTKLFMIFVVSAVVMMSATTPILWAVRIAMTMVPITLLILEKHYASAFRFLILYIIALFLTFRFLSEQSKGFLMAFLMGSPYPLPWLCGFSRRSRRNTPPSATP